MKLLIAITVLLCLQSATTTDILAAHELIYSNNNPAEVKAKINELGPVLVVLFSGLIPSSRAGLAEVNAKVRQMNLDVVLVNVERGGFDDYMKDVVQLPAFLIAGKDGKVVHRFAGKPTPDELCAKLVEFRKK